MNLSRGRFVLICCGLVIGVLVLVTFLNRPPNDRARQADSDHARPTTCDPTAIANIYNLRAIRR